MEGGKGNPERPKQPGIVDRGLAKLRNAVQETIDPSSRPPASDGRPTLEQQLRQAGMPVAEPEVTTRRQAEKKVKQSFGKMREAANELNNDRGLEEAIAEGLLEQGRIAEAAEVRRYGLIEAARKRDERKKERER